MAKLKDIAITENDIHEYLQQYSDFAFEVKVLQKLNSLGFECQHAGTYEDPVTGKTREFDIRAEKQKELDGHAFFQLYLSVECKNLRENFPLVVHCLPRESAERYLDLIWSSTESNILGIFEHSKRIAIDDINCPYEEKLAVGKSCDQVGRSLQGDVLGNDSAVFDKISQAISASYDLVSKAHYAGDKFNEVITIVVPMLVVPDDRLWTVCYERSGEIKNQPQITNNVEYYIDKSWLVGKGEHERSIRYFLSHMEIVQFSALYDVIQKYFSISTVSSLESLEAYKVLPPLSVVMCQPEDIVKTQSSVCQTCNHCRCSLFSAED